MEEFVAKVKNGLPKAQRFHNKLKNIYSLDNESDTASNLNYALNFKA